MTPAHEKRNLRIFAAAQALYIVAMVITMLLGGLVGRILSPDPALATLPVASAIGGTALTLIPASLLMGRFGRKPGFMLGALVGIGSGALCAYAIWRADFVLFCIGNLLVGAYQGFAFYYRYAAADATANEHKGRAISYVLAGGVAAAIIGPEIVRWTKDTLEPVYLVPYAALAGCGALAAILLSMTDLPHQRVDVRLGGGRPLAAIMAQPKFITAVLSAAVGYGAMILTMTATPLAMVGHHHRVADAASVIELHTLGMYVPSFFTGHLIHRLGVLRVIGAGLGLIGLCLATALSGVTLPHYFSALILLGVGWNFTFVGGTALLTEAYRPEERAKVQAASDFLIFALVAAASLGAGALLHAFGWRGVNLAAVPFLALSILVLAWVARSKRGELAAS